MELHLTNQERRDLLVALSVAGAHFAGQYIVYRKSEGRSDRTDALYDKLVSAFAYEDASHGKENEDAMSRVR